MFKLLILMMIIINSHSQESNSRPCYLDMSKVEYYQTALKTANEQTSKLLMQGLLFELISTKVDSLEDCKEASPPTSEYTCCAGTVVPVDTLKETLSSYIQSETITLCLQTQMAYTFQAYFDGIQEQFTDMIKSFTMLGCGKYNDTHMCNVGKSISSLTCAAYPLNPENLTKGYDTCCLLNFDDFNGKADKKCFDAPKKDIDYLKQVVKNYKNWGYKGVVVDCFGNYIRFGFFSFLLLVLVLFCR